MISITRGEKPEILRRKEEEWTQEYIEASNRGQGKRWRKYSQSDIREALRIETRGKCAYCESYIEHVSYSHIEHILPKSERPELVCEWTNLTLACEICNTNKDTYMDEHNPLLNPYIDDVEELIDFYGPMAVHRDSRAQLTISKLRLNRAQLLFRRQEALQEILRIVMMMARSKVDLVVRRALAEDLLDKIGREAEYTSCRRRFLKQEAPHHGVEAEWNWFQDGDRRLEGGKVELDQQEGR